jgi:hypothetical protein
MDRDTQAAQEVLVAEIKAGRSVADCRMLLGRINNGEMRAELLSEDAVDDERAADPTPYGKHVGDFLFHYIQ